MNENKKPGMRFWLKGEHGNTLPDKRYKYADEPFPKDGFPSTYRNNEFNIEFTGEMFTTDLKLAKYLIEFRAKTYVQFDPQEAVDILNIDPEWLRKLGLEVKGKAAEMPGKSDKPEAAAPNLHTMTKDELIKYADGFGIHIPVRMAKDESVAHFEKKLAEKQAKEE
ncbi:MAG: hypothetical protein DRP64_18105 [Verrucomicrobia bacterium]|nr:MAG: hypothetical protein DRP64_18105 [Verrucomicrobiota bacterium]